MESKTKHLESQGCGVQQRVWAEEQKLDQKRFVQFQTLMCFMMYLNGVYMFLLN